MTIAPQYKSQFSIFHELTKFRVREVLLVSTPYDGFVLEEDGRLSERIFNEYQDLNLHYVPRVYRVSSGEEALYALEKRNYDLVITMSRIGDMSPFDLGEKIKELYPEKPVVMLTYETINSTMVETIRKTKSIDRVFYWSGDSKILLAIIKHMEDFVNAPDDCKLGVQVILVVDDSPWYFSHFLPMIYSEIMKQTHYLIAHAVNNDHRILRARARPKILLAETYEETMDIISQYKENLIGVISDVKFPKDGKETSSAGIDLARYLKENSVDIPVILQSEQSSNAAKAHEIDVHFLDKNSPNLLLELRSFILNNYGFGSFKFRYPNGDIICEAQDIEELEQAIRNVPVESIVYHGENNHFSRWFRARTEFELAYELRHKKIASFDDPEQVRTFILDCLARFFKRYQSGVIIDFGHTKIDIENSFIKLGTGSLGGKGRGIAFFSSLLSKSDLHKKYPNVNINVPRSYIICSDVFEEFIEQNSLLSMARNSVDEEEISKGFLEGSLPSSIESNLYKLIEVANYPLAVRSSSILEDSQVLPFAGIYKTYIIPNNHPDINVRFSQLTDAIKQIYASVFLASPKQYAKNGELRIEDEKMAVLIQQLAGKHHNDVFYPTFAGVAQSYNYYPFSHMKSEHGIVSLALGFGKTIVDGEQIYKFSPAFPKMNPPYSTPTEYLNRSQASFYALDLSNPSFKITSDDNCTYKKLELSHAESDGELKFVASTYSTENDMIIDSIYSKGPRIVTFSPILKNNLFPLPEIIKDLFSMGKHAFGSDVEIEFAVQMPEDNNHPINFYFLQVRPMVVGKEAEEVKIEDSDYTDIISKCTHTIGNGLYKDIYDIIYVDPKTFDLSQTNRIAMEIGELNKILFDEGRLCVMMGFGRLGTSDPWLGIPLKWSQMSQAKIVIEADRGNLQVEPSLGSHFYHNLTTLKMGYFHIASEHTEKEFIDFEKLSSVNIVKETKFVKLVRSTKPLTIKIDGRNNKGIISL